MFTTVRPIPTAARLAVFVLATLGFAVVFACSANAQQDWQASAYKGWTVTAVEIRGLDEDVSSELSKGLALAQSTGFLGSRRPVFFPQTLNQDIDRTFLFLARHGYPHATVEPSFDPNPKRERLNLTLTIDRGPPVIIVSAPVTGMPPSLDTETREVVTLASGSVFVDEEVDRVSLALDSILAYAGYAKAKVEKRVTWEDSTRVVLQYDVKPGSVFYFGDVSVSSAGEDLVPLIHKTASIEQGIQYSPKVLSDAQRNLRVLGLFRQIRIDLVDAPSDTIDVAIDARMKESRSFHTTVRYWTDDGFSGDARWIHRNLFKRGRGLSITLFGSVFRQLAQVSSWWPALLWARSRGVVTLGTVVENEDAYRSASTGIQLSLRHEYSPQSFLRGGVSITNEDITNKSVDPEGVPEGAGRLIAFNVMWDRFAGNHPIVATEGTVWRGFGEWAPPDISDNNYVLGEMTGIVYVPFLPRSGFGLRLTVGLGEPIGNSTEIIPNKRFYSGGSNTMRGFDRRQLGPLDPAGNPLGGNSKIEASLEYRFPLLWRFRGTLFMDSGQVWSETPDLDDRRIEVAVGPGLWVETPIGPLRTDIGYRLTNYEESQPRWVFHFSIGAAF